MIIEFNQLKKDATKQLILEHCREFEDYYEYCIIDDYEEKYSKFRVHSIQIGDVFVAILEERDRLVLVAVRFFKNRFSLSAIGSWIDEMGVYFTDTPSTSVDVHNASRIVDGVRFKGRPIVVYAKGHHTLHYDATACVEVSNVYQTYDCIVNSANAKEVEVDPPCKATIFYNGKRVYSVPRIEFDLTRDLIISNGQVMVADYIEDYCGNIGFYEENNAALPIAFFYDNETPIYIDIRKRPDGSKVCVIEQDYSVPYNEL